VADIQKTGNQAFGDRLKRAREYLGVSRKELAHLTGLSYPYISQLETGYRLPSTSAMQKFVDVLPISLDELYAAISDGGEGDAEAPAGGPGQSAALIASSAPPGSWPEPDAWVVNESYVRAPPSDPIDASPELALSGRISPDVDAPRRSPAADSQPAAGGGVRRRSAAARIPAEERDLAEQIVDQLAGLPVDDQLEVVARVQARVMRRAIDEQVGRARSE